MNAAIEPTVSVVIPTYNAAAYLSEAIESVLAQTYPAAEVIVIDDGSEDEAPKLAAAYAGRITYVRQERGGPSSARNAGILAARGEWVAFLDADDIWMPNFLKELLRAGTACAADLVFCDHQHLLHGLSGGPTLQERLGIKSRLRILAPHRILLNPFELLLDVGSYFATSAVLVRRGALLEVGLFDESLTSCEDLDLWLRLAATYRFCPVREVLMHRRIHGQNMSSDRRRMITTWAEVLDRAGRYAQMVPDGSRRQKLPWNQRAALLKSQGALYWTEGNLGAARESWKKGLRATRSLKFAMYLLASYLPRTWVTSVQTWRR